MNDAPVVVVLAAGQGSRMKSALPKVLHPIGGRPMIARVLETAGALGPTALRVVYGHGGQRVPDALTDGEIRCYEQREQLGTGHALLQALPGIDDRARLLVLYGDVPLLRPETLRALLRGCPGEGLAVLSVELENPAGYGRIIRGADGGLLRIVEEKDAGIGERAIREVNTGIMTARAGHFRRWLQHVDNNNAQGEYYLTDCIELAVNEGTSAVAVICLDREEVTGINDRAQLARCERVYQRRQADRLMDSGVTLADPARLDVRGDVIAASDAFIDVNVVLEGDVHLGENVKIGPNCLVRNARIGAGSEILPNSVIEDAIIGDHCRIGPFARVRPETRLGNGVHLGNFVEVKKSRISDLSKVNHLSYIGDTDVGTRVNIGAGTITCNYDGARKYRTIIGDDAFIGSDTQLVAPVRVGSGATIGAGSTITRDAPDGELTLSRSRQTTVEGWDRPRKERD
ncbi:MAG: bifunctional UDP-N-acetylglucosamine diphosphorylase/glucosamine-1-phosphate N-acetyltransferase GlmU [Pseudomonadota bacterium]|nr:bifunctional UDP-N-acetylglucosamine diphosphorylase/glucosamine-1-phosphate N-acetyltransferase GlmU [Pseudomonadota bacterium]